MSSVNEWMQCMAVALWVSILPTFFLCSVLFLYASIMNVWVRYVFLAYLTWLLFFDLKSPFNGGWKNKNIGNWFRNWWVWDLYKDYFSAKLVKEEELDPSKSYILGFHPHGVYCLSVQANLFLNGTKGDPFKGLNLCVSTLPVNFYIPLWREFLLATNSTTVAKMSLVNVLKKGTCVLIAIGGAEEFNHMEEHCMDLVIEKRKGFAKLALETGSDLVPMIGFGENELFSRISHPIVTALNRVTYFLGKFAAPVFVGRSPTWMPKRSRLVTIVGKPIPVEKIDNPSSAQVLELHAKYLNALEDLYNKYKDVYHKERKRELRFVK